MTTDEKIEELYNEIEGFLKNHPDTFEKVVRNSSYTKHLSGIKKIESNEDIKSYKKSQLSHIDLTTLVRGKLERVIDFAKLHNYDLTVMTYYRHNLT